MSPVYSSFFIAMKLYHILVIPYLQHQIISVSRTNCEPVYLVQPYLTHESLFKNEINIKQKFLVIDSEDKWKKGRVKLWKSGSTDKLFHLDSNKAHTDLLIKLVILLKLLIFFGYNLRNNNHRLKPSKCKKQEDYLFKNTWYTPRKEILLRHCTGCMITFEFTIF